MDYITLSRENKVDLQLQDKRSLMTGSTSGLWEAIAKKLVTEGAIVAVQGTQSLGYNLFL